MSQDHLPRFMILSIKDDMLHISKAKIFGGFKKYFGCIPLNCLRFRKSFKKDFLTSFFFDIVQGDIRAPFVINCAPSFVKNAKILVREISQDQTTDNL